MWGGGWCLEWLHPPPKGFNVMGEREREREGERENYSFSCFFFQVLSFEWRHFLLTACPAATTSSATSMPPFRGHCLSCSLFGRHSDPCAAAVVRTPSGHRLFVIGSLYWRLYPDAAQSSSSLLDHRCCFRCFPRSFRPSMFVSNTNV